MYAIRSYYGYAVNKRYIANEKYMHGYFPIKVDEEIVGIVSCAVKEISLSKFIEVFEVKQYYETGFPFLIYADGSYVISPRQGRESIFERGDGTYVVWDKFAGRTAANEDFYKKIIESRKEKQTHKDAKNTHEGKVEAMYEGEEMIFYYCYSSNTDTYSIAAMHKDALTAQLNKVRFAMLFALIAIIAVLVVVILLFSKTISRPLKKMLLFTLV